MWKSTFSVSLIGDDIQTRTVGVEARTVEGTCNAGLLGDGLVATLCHGLAHHETIWANSKSINHSLNLPLPLGS